VSERRCEKCKWFLGYAKGYSMIRCASAFDLLTIPRAYGDCSAWKQKEATS
jgi:LSD1 subclass zinc finger protein